MSDETLLQNDTKRPWSVKQRILSRHGHLSNQAAAKLVAEIATQNLRHILLAHLSEDCNTPDLARATIRQNLPPLSRTSPKSTAPAPPPIPYRTPSAWAFQRTNRESSVGRPKRPVPDRNAEVLLGLPSRSERDSEGFRIETCSMFRYFFPATSPVLAALLCSSS